MRTVRAGSIRATDIHAIAIEVEVIIFGKGLRRGCSRGEGGTWRGVIVGRVEGGGYRVWIVEVRIGSIVVYERRSDGREAKVLLERPSGGYDGVFMELEGIDGEGDLWLGIESGWVHRVVQRVLVQRSLCLWIGRYHDAVDRGHLRRGLCAPFGGSSLVDASLADVTLDIAEFILSVDRRRN